MDSPWLRALFLIIHVISAGLAISQIPVGMYFKRAIARANGTPGELPLMATMGQIMGALGAISGAGLLISGLGLIAVRQFGLLGLFGPMPTSLWIKQIVFIIVILLVIFVLTPASKQAETSLRAAAQSGSPVTAEAREAFGRIGQTSMIINGLVLLNIILGVALTSGAMF